MTGAEKVVKHLEMTQAIVNRWGQLLPAQSLEYGPHCGGNMDVMKHRDTPQGSWEAALFSVTLLIFYCRSSVHRVGVCNTLRQDGSSSRPEHG